MTSEQSVLIYRDDLLPASETFIPLQAESLGNFCPHYVGLRRLPSLPLAESRVHLISRKGMLGKLQRARFKLLGPSRQLLQSLAREHPLLVHAHFALDGCNALSLARALALPLVVTFHGYDLTVNDQHHPWLFRLRRGLLMRTGARFLCVSDFLRRKALVIGFPPETTVVHYTGIDVDFFSPDSSVPRSPVVLFVGRLVPVKGCEYLIRAMSDIQVAAPDAKLVVIGDGRLRSELERQASRSVKNFAFLGVQEAAVVRAWMNRATVFCTPSVSIESGATEAFGMVFAEAQAMGLPVVSFASGGIPEAVADEQTGFLVGERDWQGLGSKILLLLRDRELWTRFSKAGQSRTRSMFNIRKQSMALENIYEQVLREWNSRSGAVDAQPPATRDWSQVHA
jgi:glycosyltransferase involved in cell wall biosynthesis